MNAGVREAISVSYIFLRLRGLHFADTGREDDRLAFADRYFEVSGNPEVFAVGDTALEVFHVLDAVVPVGIIDPSGLVAELHVQSGESLVQASSDTIFHGDYLAVDGVVCHTERIAFAESEEGVEPESGCRMSFDERVAYKDTVFMRDENFFFVRITPPTR